MATHTHPLSSYSRDIKQQDKSGLHTPGSARSSPSTGKCLRKFAATGGAPAEGRGVPASIHITQEGGAAHRLQVSPHRKPPNGLRALQDLTLLCLGRAAPWTGEPPCRPGQSVAGSFGLRNPARRQGRHLERMGGPGHEGF